jgi:hypothetical protein
MINRSGINGLVRNLNKGSIPKNTPSKKAKTYLVGRVTDIILDENHPYFNTQGQLAGLGTIVFEVVSSDNAGGIKFAKPFDPQNKNYPLVNELVVILSLPVPTVTTNSYKTQYYYLNTVDLWNSPHHNASPNPSNSQLQPSQQLDYQQVAGGLVRKVTDGSTEINLNSPINPSQNTFVEKSNIHPLMSFAGDVIIEGRWGNSLRFGSTAKSLSTYNNDWSTQGNSGDPITILRNGQPSNSNSEGWIPITETVKGDLSSIYLTSYQKIPFNLANENFVSFTTPPITPTAFTSPQIIINSDRVVLNAKKDSVLISGQNAVGISSNESINLESGQIYLDGADIKLGSKSATQPVLKGDDTVTLLKQLTTEVRNLAKSLEAAQIFPNGVPVPDVAVQSTAQLAVTNLNNILNRLDDNKNGIKSNFVKVK